MWIARNSRMQILGMLSLPALIAGPGYSQTLAPAWVISTIAGSGSNSDTGDGSAAVNAKIGKPYQAVVDKAGNLYFTEGTDVVRRIDPSGVINTVAGTSGTAGYAGDGGPATSALLSAPFGLAIDRDGNLLIADEGNEVIRRIDQNGTISTVAGTAGKTGYSGDGGAATSALLHTPYGVGADSAGNIYIADYANHVVRKVDSSGTISTFAGNGTSGVSGDGGAATQAELTSPFGIWVDAGNEVYVADYGGEVVRMIDAAGTIHTVAGTASSGGYSGDSGPATSAKLNAPRYELGDGLGNFYIADENNYVIRAVDANGTISTIAGMDGKNGYLGDGVPADTTELDFPYGLAIDAANNLYVPDASNYRIRRLSLNTGLPATAVGSTAQQNLFVESTVTATPETVAITPSSADAQFSLGSLSGCSLGAPLAAATPCTVPVNFQPAAPGLQTAQIAFADAIGSISTIGLSGTGVAPEAAFSLAAISTIIGDGSAGSSVSGTEVNAPRGGFVDSVGNIYFADSGTNTIRRVDAVSGAMTTVAGTGQAGYGGDGGAATAASLNDPSKVVADAAGDLYIADTNNNAIRYIDASTGNISTIAGTGTSGYAGDGGAAASALLDHPQGLALDTGRHVYVADTGNNVIRRLGAGSVIATVAGTGSAGFLGDGGRATSAQLSAPDAVALDGAGNVYIADTGNDVIRKLATNNAITTIAGTSGNATNAGDGAAASSASLDQPSDLAFDAAGDLYLAAGGQIRLIDISGTINTIAGTGASGDYSGDGGPATSAILPAPIANLMLDNAANIVLSATAANRLLRVNAGTPMPLNFGIQPPGTQGAATTFRVLNTGNSTLNLGSVAATAGFVLQTSGPEACTGTTSLSAGQSCSLSLEFAPPITADGAVSGTLTITDNALNAASATQIFTLSGSTKLVSNTTTTLEATPSSPVYGSPVSIAAVVNGGSAVSGSVAFSINGKAAGTAQVASGQASISLPNLPVGVAKVIATYSGDANNGSSTGTASLTVAPAVLTVTASAATMPYGTSLPSFTYTLSGFVNGDTSSVVTGAPAETTSATSTSPQGTYPIVISVGTLQASDYTFKFVNGTLTVGPPPTPDFGLGVTPTQAAIPAGGSYTATLTLTPIYGYTGSVTISCSSVPVGLGCQPTGALSGNSSGTASWTQIIISPSSAKPSASASSALQSVRIGIGFALPLGLLFGGLTGKGRRRRITSLLSVVGLTVLIAGMSACSTPQKTNVAAGTYQVTVTATDAAVNLSHSATMQLTFQ